MDTNCQNDLSTTKERLSQLLERNCFTDVTFVVGKDLKEFQAHKVILASASSVFAKMFYDPGAVEQKPIVVTDIQPEMFSQMLKYIYAETHFESCENALELYNAANKYLLNGLSNACIKYLLKELKPSNALKLFKLAKVFKNKTVEEEVLKIIREHTIQVLDSADFDNIDIADFIIILEQNELQATEYELFTALKSLADIKGFLEPLGCGNNLNYEEEKAFRFAAKKVQFYGMTLEQFVRGTALSELLLPQEKNAINACLNMPSLMKDIYPKDFTQNLRQPKNLPHVFFDFKADGLSIGRIVVQLRPDVVPKTIENLFKCNGENLIGFQNVKLDYISLNCCEVINAKADFSFITRENYVLKNKESGTIGVLYNTQNNCESSGRSFLISFNKHEDFPHNVFIGNVVKGMDVLEIIESFRRENSVPSKEVIIENCGILKMQNAL